MFNQLQGGTVAQYVTKVVTTAGTVGGCDVVPCTNSTCTHMLKVNVSDISYLLFLSSINRAGTGPSCNVSVGKYGKLMLC